MKILIGEFRQESNSFSPILSSMEFWEKAGIYQGTQIPAALEAKPCAIAGMIKALKERGKEVEIVYGVTMSCQSGGPAKQDVMDYFLERFLPIVKQSMPLDGVFFSFHGAMQTTDFEDAEGEIARRVREIVGEETVLAASTDLHAYISPTLMKHVDVISGYHTYPHIDLYETGYRAAKMGLLCLSQKETPVMARAMIPMIVSATAFNTLEGSFKELMDYGQSLVDSKILLDFSIYQMQPWLDISEGGSSTLAIAQDEETASYYAKELAQRLLSLRKEFVVHEYSIDEVIDIAEQDKSGKPVILVDSADSCNAGASGDSMAVAERLLARNSTLKAATVVNDPDAAELAHSVGVGNTAVFHIGGSRDPNAVSICAEGYVKSLHDGAFTQESAIGRGIVNNIGKTAVIRIGNLDIVVCHWMAGNGDPQLYRGFGIEPSLYQLVVVKACTSFRAAYSSIAGQICATDTPGVAPNNLMRLHYRKLPKSFYPWDSLENYQINDIIIARK